CSMRVQLQGSAGGRIETEGFWICVNKDTLTPSRLTDDCIARFSPAPALNESAQIIRRFIEDYHGQLEEQYVFPKLEQAGKLTDI
ncbi:hypothetical protein ACNJNN_21205, partial [Mycobacterium tuberculosis]